MPHPNAAEVVLRDEEREQNIEAFDALDFSDHDLARIDELTTS